MQIASVAVTGTTLPGKKILSIISEELQRFSILDLMIIDW
jgi:hypothetical protein